MATLSDLVLAVKQAKAAVKQSETAFITAQKNRENARAALTAANNALTEAIASATDVP